MRTAGTFELYLPFSAWHYFFSSETLDSGSFSYPENEAQQRCAECCRGKPVCRLYVEHLSVRETAAKLKVEDSTVSTHRKNACDKIRNAMEEQYY